LPSPIHGLLHETIKKNEAVLFCVDSGANMFVGNQKQHFSRLMIKRVGVELGTSSQGYFEGAEVIAVSIPGYKNDIFFLYPTFYSSTDKYSTISTGALKSNTGFKSVVLDAHQQLELTSKEGNSFKLPCTVIDDINFIHLNTHIIHKQASKPSNSSKKIHFDSCRCNQFQSPTN
jgi:hypothetical protein